MVSWRLLSHPAFPGWVAFPLIQSMNFVAEGFVFLAGVSCGIREVQRGRIAVAHHLNRAARLLLVVFGRHSLKIFAASIFLDYLLKALLTTLHAGATAALGVWALGMGLLLGLAYLYDEPRRRVRVRPALSGVVEG